MNINGLKLIDHRIYTLKAVITPQCIITNVIVVNANESTMVTVMVMIYICTADCT